MRYFILFFVFAVLPAAAVEIFFVPGWRTACDDPRGLTVNELEKVYPGRKITVKSWDAKQSWNQTKINAEVHTRKLIDELVNMPDCRRRELILVGHSIGAKIVVDVLNELRRRGMVVHSSALLGGALLNDDAAIANSLDAIRHYCCIVYNPDDWVLKLLYPLDNWMHTPLGLYGWTGRDYRVFESRAPKKLAGFYNHYAYLYVMELDRLVDQLPPERPTVKVLQDEPNKVRKPADQVFWIAIERFGGWKLQCNKDSGKFRIIDDLGFRRACGSENKMRAAFEDVKKQLKKR